MLVDDCTSEGVEKGSAARFGLYVGQLRALRPSTTPAAAICHLPCSHPCPSDCCTAATAVVAWSLPHPPSTTVTCLFTCPTPQRAVALTVQSFGTSLPSTLHRSHVLQAAESTADVAGTHQTHQTSLSVTFAHSIASLRCTHYIDSCSPTHYLARAVPHCPVPSLLPSHWQSRRWASWSLRARVTICT